MPIAERNTELLQIFIGQIGENIDINAVLGKKLRILAEPDLLEACRQRCHDAGMVSLILATAGLPFSNRMPATRRTVERRLALLNGIFWVLRSGAPWRDLPEQLWPLHDLLQSLRSLAAGWRLGPDHGCARRRP